MDLEILFDLLKEHKISATQMANDLGLSKNIVSEWKKGRLKPSVEAVAKIADYFGVSVDFLLGRNEYIAAAKAPRSLKDVAEMLVQLSETEELKLFFGGLTESPMIGFDNNTINKFMADWNSLMSLLKNGTITREVYEVWLKGKYSELREIKLNKKTD